MTWCKFVLKHPKFIISGLDEPLHSHRPTPVQHYQPESLARGWGRSEPTWPPSWARTRPPHPGWSPPPRSCRGSRQSGAYCGWAGPEPSPRRLPSSRPFPSPPHLQASNVSISSILYFSDLLGIFSCIKYWRSLMRLAYPQEPQYSIWTEVNILDYFSASQFLLCTGRMLLWLWLVSCDSTVFI